MAEVNLNTEVQLLDLSEEKPQVEPSETESKHKAALAAGARFPDDQVYNEVTRELANSGTSSSIDRIVSEGQNRKINEQALIIDEILGQDLPLPDTQLAIDAALDQNTESSLKEEFETRMASQARSTGSDRRSIQQSIVDRLIFQSERPELVRQIEAQEFTLDADTAVRDVVTSFALPGYGIQYYEVLNEAMPNIAEISDVAFPGDMVNRYREALQDMTPAEQEAAVRSLARAIERNTFFGMDNGFIKQDLMASILGDFKTSTVDEVFINIIAIADILALGEAVRLGGAAIKGIANSGKLLKKSELASKVLNNYYERRTPGTVADELDKVAPEESRELSEAILEGDVDPRNVGTSEAQVTSVGILPEPSDVNPTVAPDLNDAVEITGGLDVRGILFDGLEKLGAENRAEVRAQAILDIAPTLHLNKTKFTPIPGGLEAETIIGNLGSGFRSIQKAKTAQEQLRGEFPTTVVARDSSDNTLKELDEIKQENLVQEFYLKFNDKVMYSAEDAVGLNPIKPDGLTGRLAGLIAGKSSYLDNLINLAGLAAGDVKAARTKVLSQQLEPLFDLGRRKRELVEDIIDRGDQIGKEFSEDELILEWGHRSDFNELLNAYEGFTRFQKTQWNWINTAMRERLEGMGMKHVVVKGENYLGRPVRDVSADTTRVYDPRSDSIVDIPVDFNFQGLSNAQKELLSNRNFIQLRTPIVRESEETLYALNITDDVVISSLPEDVIKNVPGRIPRSYDVTHLVKYVVPRFRNGKPVEALIPVHMAQNSGEARRMADELEFSHPKYDPTKPLTPDTRRYRWTPARELREDAEYADRLSLDYYEDNGYFWYSERGQELGGVDGKRIVMPVLDRLRIAQNKAASIGTLDVAVEKWIKNWEREFGTEFGIDGRMPGFEDPLPRNIPFGESNRGLSDRRYKDAVAFRDHIALVSGFNPDWLRRNIRQGAVYVADRLATPQTASAGAKIRNWGATKVLQGRNVDPVNIAKQFAFVKYIIGNPLRQLALQSQQATVYAGIPGAAKYFATGKGVRDWTALVAGLASRDNPTMWKQTVKSVSRGMGMTPEEYTEFVDAMRNSGLLANIDSHAFSAGMLTDKTFGGSNGFTKGTADVTNGLIQTMKLIRKLGFDAGEASQLIVAFLAKRNEWIQNNPTKSTRWAENDNLLQIASEARQASFEMTREGALGLQKGILGLVFQFASHNIKASQALLPNTRFLGIGKLSNKAFSNKQKAGIALSQLGYYGVGGYGVYEAYDEFKANLDFDIPESLDLAVKEGLFGSLVTAIVGGATQEPFDVDISGNIAPFSGVVDVPLYRVLGDATTMGMFDITQIPAVNVAKDIKDSLSMLGFLTGPKLNLDELGLSEVDRGLLVLDEIARNIPIYEKSMRARAEIAMQQIISRSGDARVNATTAEILANANFGLKPTADRQGFELKRKIKGRAGVFANDGLGSDLANHAKTLYEHAMKLARRVNPENTFEEARDILRGIAIVDAEILSDFEYRRVHQQLIPQLIYSNLREGTADAELIRTVESKLKSGGIETSDTFLRRLGQSKTLTREEEAIAEFLREIGE